MDGSTSEYEYSEIPAADSDLWNAADRGDAKGTEAALQNGADANFLFEWGIMGALIDLFSVERTRPFI